jgi:ABC-type nitrate/sulfonate/bicarbonate transport systems, periplasmic components
MKKIIILFMIIVMVVVGIVFNPFKTKKDNELITIKVAEVARTVFYAPWYLAIEEGYFVEEGLEIDLILTPGADKVAAAVLSGDVDVGFCGPEATIYIFNGNEKDYLMSFAGLTKRDGTFIVSREPIDNFTLNDLKGQTVIGGRKGGMPEMTFEMALRENGIDPNTDLIIDTSIEFAAMQGAFIGGTGDFVTLFEPNASILEEQGLGYIVAAVGELGGEVPYTTFNARKSYIESNLKDIQKFNNAINRGLEYVRTHTPEEIARAITKYFPDTSIDNLARAIDNYREFDVWKDNTTIVESEFNRLQEIMIDAGELGIKVNLEDLVITKFFDSD